MWWTILYFTMLVIAVGSGLVWATSKTGHAPRHLREGDGTDRTTPEPVAEVPAEPDTDSGVDETGYVELNALQALPAEIDGQAFADPLGYEIAVALWEWEQLSTAGFSARINDALMRFEAGMPMRVVTGADYPVAETLVIAEDLPRWRLDTAHMLSDVWERIDAVWA
jgi:hypothetical protein